MTLRFFWIGLAALVLGCGGSITVEFGEQGGGGSTGSQNGGGPQGGNGGSCDDDQDCGALSGPCATGFCRAGTCIKTPANEGSACDDGQFCTVADHCTAGACVAGSELSCPPGNSCQVGSCDDSVDACVFKPVNDGALCDDGDLCTGDGFCSQGQCFPGQDACGALNGECTIGVCTPMGCVANVKPNGTPCNDGNFCTSVDACNAGSCMGTGGPLTYFSDDFSDNSAGWTVQGEWQFGSAATSTGHTFGNPDPSVDHSSSTDNGVVGVVIGGNANVTMPHDFQWLESPVFNATIDPGPVILSYFRWLNSDWDPWMNNRVEVWTGMAWLTVWESRGQPVTDAAWTKVEHDLTPYKNAAMRVRFGFHVGNIGNVFIVSGWNIDDLVVATASCN
jgi:hypothetical protein